MLLTILVSSKRTSEKMATFRFFKTGLDLDIDLRIGVDVWEDVWASPEETDDTLLASLLRFVYARGYNDALVEPQRGQLFRDHGFPVPRRRRSTPAV